MKNCCRPWMQPKPSAAQPRCLMNTPICTTSITSRAALNAELARILKQGYALDNEEREEGLHCIGAPIFDHTGLVVATLSVSWPGFRYGRGDEAEKIEKVKAAAGRISTILGYEP